MQVRHAFLELGVVTTGCVEAFLSHRQLVVQRLGIAGCALAPGLAVFSGHQAQVVLGVDLLGRLVGTGATSRVHLLLATGTGAAALAPGSILRRHFSNCLGLRQRGALHHIGQAQHLAGLQPIDVAIDKGIRVQRLDRQHGLLDRGTVAVLGGDFPQGVTGRGGVLLRLAGLVGAGDRGTHRRGAYWRALGSGGGLRGEFRWVQQHTVVAQQAAVGPHHLHQELDHRLRQRLARGHPQHALAAGIENRGETQVVEKGLAINAGLGELFCRRKAGHYLGGSEVLDIEQFDFCYQRLVQTRLQGQLPKPKRLRHTGGQRRGGRYC